MIYHIVKCADGTVSPFAFFDILEDALYYAKKCDELGCGPHTVQTLPDDRGPQFMSEEYYAAE